MQRIFMIAICLVALTLGLVQTPAMAQDSPAAAQASVSPGHAQEYGIAAKRPVFAGACKACPWGVLGTITAQAMAFYGYDVQICWICSSTVGPRVMGDKTKPVMSPSRGSPDEIYVETPPDAVPDISATSDENLIDAWNWTGNYASDHKDAAPTPRRNFKVIAVVQQPNYLIAAANKRSGITDLAQIKDRIRPTWIALGGLDGRARDVLAYYGITEQGLKAHGGGILPGSVSREMRATADVWIGGAVLADTPEHRMWYEVSQLADLVYLNLDDALLDKFAKEPGVKRATVPLAYLRGVDRPIPTVMRSANYIYVRSDAPESFTYAVAKALDEHQDLFEGQESAFWYDPKRVASTITIPMAAGALKYYRERGYIK